MLTKKDLLEVRDEIRHELKTLLDEYPTRIVDYACQVVVDGFTRLLTDYEDTEVFVVYYHTGGLTAFVSLEEAKTRIGGKITYADYQRGVWHISCESLLGLVEIGIMRRCKIGGNHDQMERDLLSDSQSTPPA